MSVPTDGPPGPVDGPEGDLPALEEMDPSLQGGFQLFYEREVPFELRSAEAVDMPTEVCVCADACAGRGRGRAGVRGARLP